MATKHQDRCAICLDSFKDPRLIPCHHSFCFICLEDYVSGNPRNGKFKCPICRRSAKLPKKGVEAFQVNFYIDSNESTRSTSDGNSSGVICDVCGSEKEARCTCMECMQNLCQCCCENHEKLRATKNHTLYNIGSKELEINSLAYKRALCRKHTGEKIQLVCIECRPNIPMCLKCKAYDHDTHRSKSINEAAAEIKRNLMDLLNSSSTFQSKNSLKELEDKERREIESIDQQHSKLKSALDELVTDMKSKVKSEYGKQKKANVVLTMAKTDAEKLIEQGTCIDIVEKGQVLLRSLSKTVSEMKPLLVGTKKTLFAPAVIKHQQLTAVMGTLQNDPSHENHSSRYFSHMQSGYERHDDYNTCNRSLFLDLEDLETLRKEKQKRLSKHAVSPELYPFRGKPVVGDEPFCQRIMFTQKRWPSFTEPSNPNDETKAKEVSGPSEPNEETKAKEVSDVCIPDRSGPEGSSGASSVSTEASIISETTDEETHPKKI